LVHIQCHSSLHHHTCLTISSCLLLFFTSFRTRFAPFSACMALFVCGKTIFWCHIDLTS
jgi:hypothetical protein